MNTTETFLIALSIIFSLPYLIWRLGHLDYFAPLVVVQILTGILLSIARVAGETAPLLFTSFNNRFFTTSLTQPISTTKVTNAGKVSEVKPEVNSPVCTLVIVATMAGERIRLPSSVPRLSIIW